MTCSFILVPLLSFTNFQSDFLKKADLTQKYKNIHDARMPASLPTASGRCAAERRRAQPIANHVIIYHIVNFFTQPNYSCSLTIHGALVYFLFP